MAASTPEINVAGFFGGATELARFLVDQGATSERNSAENLQKVLDIDGQKYTWNRNNYCWVPVKPVNFIPDDPVVPDAYEFFTLDGLIDYIRENTEGLIPDDPDKRLILQVVDHKHVRLMSHPSENHKKRHVIAECTAHTPRIVFDSYLDTERFNTMLLSNFIETDSRETLFKVVSAMTKEQSCNTTDDGVSQVITVKQGVSMAANVTFKNPVPLKPIRTFAEVDQPESNFTLRVNDSADVALFEADGGVWMNTAVALIRDYLNNNLYGCNVAVIA